MAEQAGAKLLVVDDEPNIVELLSASLRYAGFEVSSARSGREAVDRIREVRPDLVILDVLMPGVDGLSVLRQLRGNGIDVPVLFLTARTPTRIASPGSRWARTTTSRSRSASPR